MKERSRIRQKIRAKMKENRSISSRTKTTRSSGICVSNKYSIQRIDDWKDRYNAFFCDFFEKMFIDLLQQMRPTAIRGRRSFSLLPSSIPRQTELFCHLSLRFQTESDPIESWSFLKFLDPQVMQRRSMEKDEDLVDVSIQQID